jgi:hypothetical protein
MEKGKFTFLAYHTRHLLDYMLQKCIALLDLATGLSSVKEVSVMAHQSIDKNIENTS